MKKVILALTIVLLGCENVPCDIHPSLREQYEKANSLYPREIRVENIPCETFDINLIILTPFVDTSKISKIQSVLYDKEKNHGWQNVNVYNTNRKYLFSRFYTGKISHGM